MATEGPNLFEHYGFSTRLWILNHLTGVNSRMLLVLRAINDQARGQSSVVMTREQIAKYWLTSVSTVQRAVTELEQAGLLHCDRSVDQRGQQANRYQIIWSNLKAIADGESEEAEWRDEPDEIRPGQYDSPPGQNDSPPVHHEPAPGSICTDPRFNLHRPPVQNEPAYYIPLGNLNNHHHLTGTLEMAAAEILKSLGVEHPLPAVQAALGRGITLADVEQIAEFYRSRPGCWDAGALQRKVKFWMPGDAPAQSWPKPDPKWLARQKSQQQAVQVSQQRQKHAASKLDDLRAVNDLETRHGPRLDAMSDADVLRMIQQTPGGKFYISTWRKSGRESQSLRRWLLGQFERMNDDDENENSGEKPTAGQCRGAAEVARGQ